ncbi:stealth family protein [Frigoribacterium sp. CG_9.8]|uniref:stealth family protein n=1 Tax=Frigoribacterium sp. CG_9.8 TaxID=2787733 RepID=UPI001E28C9AE|nr:stealth family protein [Frigoribacterium sp. CG_9.8]
MTVPAMTLPAMTLRSDLVLAKGRLALLNTGATPQEAMIEDLLFVRSVLDVAGIDFLLVRGNDSRPVLAVDWRDRKVLRTALARACVDEPFYSKPADGSRGETVLLADGRLARDSKTRAVLLFRPRITGEGALRYGAGTGVRLELWKSTADAFLAADENALMRTTLPREEAVRGTVALYGQDWPTLEGMFAAQVQDIDFDIDIVFSWVDGAAIEWQRARARRMKAYVVGEGDDSHARFRQLDELKYALRSVYLFAPWVRNIYIATDSPRPEWLAEHPRVTIVPSEQFFADPTVLPTHNSHAVESQLHNIPGLSEHFLYSNDDMFFGRAVSPEMFFSPGGVTKFIEATTRIGMGESNLSRSGFENAARVNRRLIQERFGRTITRHLEHTPTPLRKSVMQQLESEFPQDFRRTAASTFRSATDISVTNSLYHFYAWVTGRAVEQTAATVSYIDTTLRTGLAEMTTLLKRRNVDMFCLNDGSFPELSAEERAAAVRSFLDSYYPIAAPWERPTGDAVIGESAADAFAAPHPDQPEHPDQPKQSEWPE